jgi:hypothetical protein
MSTRPVTKIWTSLEESQCREICPARKLFARRMSLGEPLGKLITVASKLLGKRVSWCLSRGEFLGELLPVSRCPLTKLRESVRESLCKSLNESLEELPSMPSRAVTMPFRNRAVARDTRQFSYLLCGRVAGSVAPRVEGLVTKILGQLLCYSLLGEILGKLVRWLGRQW